MRIWNVSWVLALCGLSFLWSTANADQKKNDVKVGDLAPVFDSVDDQGQVWKSRDHVGKNFLVIYFYPADLTPGCTKQACSFRDDMKSLAKKGVEVVGVSGDSVENHQVFKKTKHLNFTLLSDEKGKVAKKFGVDVKDGGEYKIKDSEGNPVVLKRGVTAMRWTFVIGKDGKILYKNTKVNPTKDSKEILALVDKQEN